MTIICRAEVASGLATGRSLIRGDGSLEDEVALEAVASELPVIRGVEASEVEGGESVVVFGRSAGTCEEEGGDERERDD